MQTAGLSDMDQIVIMHELQSLRKTKVSTLGIYKNEE